MNNKKTDLINLALLFHMRNNTNEKHYKKLANELIESIMHKNSFNDDDILKVYKNLNNFINSF
tara:strand:+ start:243 stop:431 length:189 start_codon:yes stop_codon:yes gene_type:complete